MLWLAQQRYVAWLLAGIAPTWLMSTPLAAAQYPASQRSSATATLDGSDRNLRNLEPLQDDSIDVAPPVVSLPDTSSAPAPQPISNPLPPAFWSALSMLGVVGIFLAFRRLKSQLR